MHGSIHRLFLALVAAFAVTTSPVSAEEGAATLKRSADLLAANCARCHATGTTGSGPHPDAPTFRTLSQKYPMSGRDCSGETNGARSTESTESGSKPVAAASRSWNPG